MRVDADSKTLTVGPESAGADPGPACYGKGGLTATVTDADVVLGRINPDNFLGGRMRLDRDEAIAAVQRIADPLKLSLMEAASGIARIAEFKMADIIRKMTVEKGFDPRDFVLFAFGGAGPAHAGVFAHELGVQKVVIPQKEIASTWCAFGAASADILHVYEQVDIQPSPFDAQRVNGVLDALERKAQRADGPRRDRADRAGAFSSRSTCGTEARSTRSRCCSPAGACGADSRKRLSRRFYTRYEQLFGRGSSYADARLEIVTLRLRATAATTHPKLTVARRRGAAPSARAACWAGARSTGTS